LVKGRRVVLCAVIATMILASLSVVVQGRIIQTTRFNGRFYYVDLVAGPTWAEVWFRVAPDKCSYGDIRVISLNIGTKTLAQAQPQICRAKNIFDYGRTIVGCGTTIGTGICVYVIGATGGIGTVVCGGTITYALSTGIADCIYGLSDAIADALGFGYEWRVIRHVTGISPWRLSSIVDLAIETMCQDVYRAERK